MRTRAVESTVGAESAFEALGPISEELPAGVPAPITVPAEDAETASPAGGSPRTRSTRRRAQRDGTRFERFEFTRRVAPVFVPFFDPRPPKSDEPARSSKSSALVLARPERVVAPRLVLLGSVIFGLWSFSAQRLSVAYPNDSSVHVLTVKFALAQLRAGHFPMSGWFPYLSLGSPFLMHYQSTPAILTGLLALLIGAPHAFAWVLYLGVALWPVSVYYCARVFGFERWVAAVAAACAPLVNSITGYGYEHQSYDWLGNGLWTQMWGMWLLPLAWAWTWRAVRDRRYLFPAVVSLGLTIAFHFLTAYLAGLSLVLWVFLRPSRLWARAKNAALVALGALGATLWVTVPIVVFAKWDATNEFQVGTFWDDSYGARQILSWLAHGQLFDHGRSLPVLTVLVGLGIVTCVVTWRRDERARAVLSVFLLSLALYFGRPTLGFVLDLLPGNKNLFFQRYLVGVQLGGLLLAGIGLVATVRLAVRVATDRIARWRDVTPLGPRRAFVTPTLAVGLLLVLLAPAWQQVAQREGANVAAIEAQQLADTQQGYDISQLVAKMHSIGPGRAYAGMPTNWGATFYVGQVPVYIYLANLAVDTVGFTLRTSALMTDPEAYFDEYVPGDYKAFGIRYLLLPTTRQPSVPATFVEQAGPFTLWTVDGVRGLVQVVDTSGSIAANAADLGRATRTFLETSAVDTGIYPTIAFDGGTAAPPTLPAGTSKTTDAGSVSFETDDLADGTVTASVDATRDAVVLLSASYDPGWTATVDGVSEPTEMVAPALVGVAVGPGQHFVSFSYQRFDAFPLLFGIAVATVAGIGLGPWWWRRRRRAGSDEAA